MCCVTCVLRTAWALLHRAYCVPTSVCNRVPRLCRMDCVESTPHSVDDTHNDRHHNKHVPTTPFRSQSWQGTGVPPPHNTVPQSVVLSAVLLPGTSQSQTWPVAASRWKHCQQCVCTVANSTTAHGLPVIKVPPATLQAVIQPALTQTLMYVHFCRLPRYPEGNPSCFSVRAPTRSTTTTTRTGHRLRSHPVLLPSEASTHRTCTLYSKTTYKDPVRGVPRTAQQYSLQTSHKHYWPQNG